ANGAIPDLLKLLNSPPAGDAEEVDRLVSVAAWALGRVDTKGVVAIDALTKLLKKKQTGLKARWKASEALGDFGPLARTAIPTLVKVMEDADASREYELKNCVAEALRKIRGEKSDK